jgi:hypothetical protein
VLISDVDPSLAVGKDFEEEWVVESFVVDFAKSAARNGELDAVFDGLVEGHSRRFEIQNQLRRHGLRMEASLGAFDGDGHAVMDIATGEMASDAKLTPEVIALATEWSVLETPELANEDRLASNDLGGPQTSRVNANVDHGLLFAVGTGDRWNCQTQDGMGISIEPVGQGKAWDWSASRAWWDGVGSGQAGTREAAIDAACARLIEAGLDLSELPTQASILRQPLTQPLLASSQDDDQKHSNELLVTTDPAALIRAALTYATEPEKVNVDWLCASLQAAVNEMSGLSSARNDEGFVLAFPGASDAEGQELVDTLRRGGNTVVLVDDISARMVLKGASTAIGAKPEGEATP